VQCWIGLDTSFDRLSFAISMTDLPWSMDEEQFGPVLPIVRIKDEEDGLRRANASTSTNAS
jgi:hypothetical protein